MGVLQKPTMCSWSSLRWARAPPKSVTLWWHCLAEGSMEIWKNTLTFVLQNTESWAPPPPPRTAAEPRAERSGGGLVRSLENPSVVLLTLMRDLVCQGCWDLSSPRHA